MKRFAFFSLCILPVFVFSAADLLESFVVLEKNLSDIGKVLNPGLSLESYLSNLTRRQELSNLKEPYNREVEKIKKGTPAKEKSQKDRAQVEAQKESSFSDAHKLSKLQAYLEEYLQKPYSHDEEVFYESVVAGIFNTLKKKTDPAAVTIKENYEAIHNLRAQYGPYLEEAKIFFNFYITSYLKDNEKGRLAFVDQVNKFINEYEAAINKNVKIKETWKKQWLNSLETTKKNLQRTEPMAATLEDIFKAKIPHVGEPIEPQKPKTPEEIAAEKKEAEEWA